MAGIVLAILAILIVQSAAGDYDHCYRDSSNYGFLFGSKTTYADLYNTSWINSPLKCEPVQIWVLARHGIQYPDRQFIKRLPKLKSLHEKIINETEQSGKLCTIDFQSFRNWKPQSYIENEIVADQLSDQGKKDFTRMANDLRGGLHQIFWINRNDILSGKYKFQFRSTNSEETQASLKSLIRSIFGNENALPVEEPPAIDTLLSAYKYCPAWNSSVENDRVNAEAKKFIAGPEYQGVVTNVRRRLGFNDTIDNDTIQMMYDMCRYETAFVRFQESPWCTVFAVEDFKVLEYHEDLQYYYYSGPGRDINAQLGCTPLKDLFTHFKNLEQGILNGNIDNEPKGVFYFTDTITVQNFLAALGITNDSAPLRADNFQSMNNRRFRTSITGASASNLAAVFYRCEDPDSQNKMVFYLNGNPVKIEGCSDTLCDWDDLKDRFGKTVEECSFDSCNLNNKDRGNSASTIANYEFSIALVLILVVRLIL